MLLWCAFGSLLLLAPLRAQTRIAALAAEIEKNAQRESSWIGFDTRLLAVERIRTVDPATARVLLDNALRLASQGHPPGYLIYRAMDSYAVIDPDAAEKAAVGLPEQAWAYNALIDKAVKARDLGRADRLVRKALSVGLYALGGIRMALEALNRQAPHEAQALLREYVAAFPSKWAAFSEAHSLLLTLAAFPNRDAELSRQAVTNLFRALDRADFCAPNPSYEDKAEYRVRGKTIKTETTCDTILLPSAAWLSGYDPAAFRAREAELPEWRADIQNLSVSELDALARTEVVRHAHPAWQEPMMYTLRPELLTMTYAEAIEAVHKLEFPARYHALFKLLYRKDLNDAEYAAVFQEMAPLFRRFPAPARYQLGMQLMYTASQPERKAVFAEAARLWIQTLDEIAPIDDPDIHQNHGRGDFRRSFDQLIKHFANHDFALAEPHPSMVARRLLTELDAAASERPDFTLASLDGKTFTLSKLKGKVVLIDFWATWCPPCVDAVPHLENLNRELAAKGLVVLGIDDEVAGRIEWFRSKNGVTYPTLLDPDRKVHNLFGVDSNGQGIPMTVVFDREGRYVGRVPYPHDEKNFRAVLKKAGLE